MSLASPLEYTPELLAVLETCQSLLTEPASTLLIDATAGSGKTTALTMMHRRLNSSGVRAQGIAFSKRGVRQYLKLYGPHGKDWSPCLGFDAMCLSSLQRFSSENRWKLDVVDADIGDMAAAIEAMGAAIAHVNLAYAEKDGFEPLVATDQYILDALKLIKNIKISLAFERSPFLRLETQGELTDDDEFDVAAALADIKLPLYAFSLFNAYENRRKNADFMLYGDAVYDLARERNALRAYLEYYAIDMVLIDEFHDIKPVHFRILNLIRQLGIKVIAVGDEAQDIFAWRGIRPFNVMAQLRTSGAVVLPLHQTYRFGEPLAARVATQLGLVLAHDVQLLPAKHATMAEEILPRAQDEPAEVLEQALAVPPRTPIPATANPAIFREGDEGIVDMLQLLRKRSEAVLAKRAVRPPADLTPANPNGKQPDNLRLLAALIERIDQLREAGLAMSDMAIIVPSPSHGYSLMRDMILGGLSIWREGIAPFHASDDALLIRALIRVAGWSERPLVFDDAKAITTLLRLPYLPLSPALRRAFSRQLDGDATEPAQHRNRSAPHVFRMDELAEMLTNLRQELRLSTTLTCSSESIHLLSDRYGFKEWISGDHLAASSQRAVARSLAEQASRVAMLGADGYLAELDLVRTLSQNVRQADSIVFTTVRQCKGAQWPMVVMPPVLWQDHNNTEMQQRETYVAMTRAQRWLYY